MTMRDTELYLESSLENIGHQMGQRKWIERPLHPRVELANSLMSVLGCPGQHPVLIGDSGSGRASVIETAAVAMRGGRFRSGCTSIVVPPGLNNTKLIETTPSNFLSGALYANQLEHKTKLVVQNLQSEAAVLVMPSLPSFVGSGSSSVDPDSDVPNLLTPFLRRGDVRIIGTATPAGFRQLQRLRPAFAQLLCPLDVPPVSDEEAMAILDVHAACWRPRQIRPSEQALHRILQLSRMLFPSRAIPGAAVSLLELVAGIVVQRRAQALTQTVSTHQSPVENDTLLTAATVEEVAGEVTGVPTFLIKPSIALQRQAALDHFARRIHGQPAALAAIVDRIMLLKGGLFPRLRPVASLLLAGPTGVGKTLLARKLAEYLLGDKQKLIRFDMSEYATIDSLDRLVGENRLHHQADGLVDAVLEQPFPVILLDEIEKAHRVIFDALLQVLGEGRLTDLRGRTASFSNAIILMTSNLGSGISAIQHPPAADDDRVYESHTRQAIRRYFRPELINRLSDILVFRHLDHSAIVRIAMSEIEAVLAHEALSSRRMTVRIDRSIKLKLIEQGYSKAYGARPMTRAVERLVAIPVARFLAENPSVQRAQLEVVVKEQEVKVYCTHSRPPVAPRVGNVAASQKLSRQPS
jgi:ATP-dependent Clp protease ATP-binding subunit ClpA